MARSKVSQHSELATVPPVERSAPVLRKARTQDSRRHNRALITRLLYQHPELTRSELARASGLTPPTVSALVAELETDGLVIDLGARVDGRVGKPATVVQLAQHGKHIVCADLSHPAGVAGAVLDLRGNVVHRASRSLSAHTGQAAIDVLIELLDELARATDRPLLGLGVGSPGVVDENGHIRLAVHLDWHDVPLADILERRFGVPAFVGNDVNLMALGVHHFRPSGHRNVMVMTLEPGVGIGLVVDGRLVVGEQFSAGEVGHVTVREGGTLCVCGRHGCLEAEIRDVRTTPDSGMPDRLERAGRALGTLMAPVVSVLNLQEVVLVGPSHLVDGPLREATARTCAERTLQTVTSPLSVRSLSDESDLTLLGGASMVLASELGAL